MSSLPVASSYNSLLESSHSLADSPLELFVADISYYSIHNHPELELIYVLDGAVSIRSSIDHIDLSADEFHIINSNDIHEIWGKEKHNNLLFIHIPLDRYTEYESTLDQVIFSSRTDIKETPVIIKELIAEIYKHTCLYPEENQDIVRDLTIRLLMYLYNNFQYASRYDNSLYNASAFKDKKGFHMQRVHRISNYIYENYSEKITLDELAKKEYISKYYLTHILKSATGCSFQDLLTLVRVEESEKLLLSSDISIEDLAYKCGFSSPSNYAKNFKTFFGATPSVYRKEHADKLIGILPPDIEILPTDTAYKLLVQRFRITDNAPGSFSSDVSPKAITINTHDTDEFTKPCSIPPVAVVSDDISDFFSGRFMRLLEFCCEDIEIKTVVIRNCGYLGMYDTFKDFSWMNSIAEFCKSHDLELLIEESPVCNVENHPEFKFAEIGSASLLSNAVTGFCSENSVFSVILPSETLLGVSFSDIVLTDGANMFRSKFYYTLYFLQQAFGNIVSHDENYILTDDARNYCIVIRNSSDIMQPYVVKWENITSSYSIIKYTLDATVPTESDLYKQAGSPEKLDDKTSAAIKKEASPKAEISHIKGSLFYHFPLFLPPKSEVLVTMKKL